VEDLPHGQPPDVAAAGEFTRCFLPCVVLFDMQNRTFGLYLAAINRILAPRGALLTALVSLVSVRAACDDEGDLAEVQGHRCQCYGVTGVGALGWRR
jgi:hypothetical protein